MGSDLMIHGTDAPCSVQVQDSAHYFHCSWLRNVNQHRIDCYSSVNFINKMNTSSQNIQTHCKIYFIARPVKYHSEIATEPHSLCSTLFSLAQPVPQVSRPHFTSSCSFLYVWKSTIEDWLHQPTSSFIKRANS